MRCSQCGMPLSPSRTHCPRCGFAAGEASNPGTHNGADTSQGQRSGPPAPWATQVDPSTPGAVPMQQLSFPMNNNTLTPARNADGSLYAQPPTNHEPEFVPATPQPIGWTAPAQLNPSTGNARMAQPFPQRPPTPTPPKRSTRAGFIAASLCLVAGALLLIFIYVLSQNFVGSPTAQVVPTAISTQGVTATAGNATSTSTNAANLTATAAVTPTTLPAQKYIVQAQMAAVVNEQTAIPSVLGTAFHIQQKTYLVMTVDPLGQAGAICLQWYINNQHLTNYDFSFLISPNSQHAFSYIFPSVAGPAYVEIYWASSKQCTDQTLAQRVDFTVTA